MTMPVSDARRRLPPWLKVPLGGGEQFAHLKGLVRDLKLHTVCESARCPNLGECWSAGTGTFMILGNICTRGCTYCAVPKGRPEPLDLDEPRRVTEAVKAMRLRHIVVTSVDRDDVPDGGASVFAELVRLVHAECPGTRVELLIPDFRFCKVDALKIVMDAGPDFLNHNIETVPRLFPTARKGGNYEVSLRLLQDVRTRWPQVPSKSGMMLGLGEEDHEVEAVLADLRRVGVRILTLGQYLRPDAKSLPVAKFYAPEEFSAWGARARAMGFDHVESAPLVRSSYHAERQVTDTVPGSLSSPASPPGR
ncbi:MAG: lipoyl synthase [Planctomycetaceae bacterium]|nr:lipoyl synthase [Planctomycetota bacterium]NUN53168.1 lipoyl synthase [Planctomycetaceae bacterium]